MPRLVYLTTAGVTARSFLEGQLAYLRARGYDITVVSAPGASLDEVARREGVRVVGIPMQREISPLSDLVSVAQLYRLFRSLRPDIVNAGTPKAGLLGTLAAWLARVPVRLYTVHGLRLETARGAKRVVLACTERLASLLAHKVICVSPSLRRRCVELGLVRESKTTVLGSGSANGLDAARFGRSPANLQKAAAVRARFGILPDEPVIGFVGRLTRDKGTVELVEAFDRVRAEFPRARLLLLGDFEDGDPVPADCAHRLKNDPRMILTGFIEPGEISGYYLAMDVIAFPTYREGFPNVPLEAAAAGVPVVGFRATGVVDAIVDGVTGAIVPLGDAVALADALARYLRDAALRRAHGAAARERVLREFRQEPLWRLLLETYDALLKHGGVARGPMFADLPERSPVRDKAGQRHSDRELEGVK